MHVKNLCPGIKQKETPFRQGWWLEMSRGCTILNLKPREQITAAPFFAETQNISYTTLDRKGNADSFWDINGIIFKVVMKWSRECMRGSVNARVYWSISKTVQEVHRTECKLCGKIILLTYLTTFLKFSFDSSSQFTTINRSNIKAVVHWLYNLTYNMFCFGCGPNASTRK